MRKQQSKKKKRKKSRKNFLGQSKEKDQDNIQTK